MSFYWGGLTDSPDGLRERPPADATRFRSSIEVIGYKKFDISSHDDGVCPGLHRSHREIHRRDRRHRRRRPHPATASRRHRHLHRHRTHRGHRRRAQRLVHPHRLRAQPQSTEVSGDVDRSTRFRHSRTHRPAGTRKLHRHRRPGWALARRRRIRLLVRQGGYLSSSNTVRSMSANSTGAPMNPP